MRRLLPFPLLPQSIRGPLVALATVALLAHAASAAIVIGFETEDDGLTPLVNGQIVDPAFDAVDPEFGTHFTLTTLQLGSDGHNGATIFDTDPNGPNQGSQDPDLLVDRGNILIFQSDNPGSANDTSVDPVVGLVYDNPNDEADFADAGAFVFSFLSPVELLSIDFVDANGGFLSNTILTDGSGLTRTYTIPKQWTGDIDTCGGCQGWDTLDFTTLANQLGEGGGTATALEDVGFDPTDVVGLEIQFLGNPSSGGVDNLTFVPEPTTGGLLALGLAGLAAFRRSGARR
ncbi:MAG: PEP-CTERM sorting domain-containing protein [Myxococcota bacterium]